MFLINAQGEDVVAGIRTPQQTAREASQRWAEENGISESERATRFPSLEEVMPDCYRQLLKFSDKLERHYRDMQDMEFTIENGRLWMLQTRNGKRTAAAAIKIAVDLANEGLISREDAIKRVTPDNVNSLLHPHPGV